MKRSLLSLTLALGLAPLAPGQQLLDTVYLEGVPIRETAPQNSGNQASGAGEDVAVNGARGFGFQTVGPGLSATGSGGNYTIRILEIRPLSGNNPLDPVEPLLNFNGQRVQTVTELVQVIQTGGSGGAGTLAACARSTPMNIVYTPGPAAARSAIVFGANMNICPQSLDCTSPPPGVPSQGNFSFTLQTMLSGPVVECYAGTHSSATDWRFDDHGTLKNFGIVRHPNQNFTLIAVSGFGARIEMVLRVDDTGVGTPVFHVLSIRRLN